MLFQAEASPQRAESLAAAVRQILQERQKTTTRPELSASPLFVNVYYVWSSGSTAVASRPLFLLLEE